MATKEPVRDFTHAIDCGGPSPTQQSHADGNSIREIGEKFRQTGVLPESLRVPQWIDISEVPTLLQSMDTGARFNFYFSQLPAEVRAEFKNDPRLLLGALSDPDEKDRLIELGISDKPPVVPGPPLGSKDNPIHSVVPDPPAPPTK